MIYHIMFQNKWEASAMFIKSGGKFSTLSFVTCTARLRVDQFTFESNLKKAWAALERCLSL